MLMTNYSIIHVLEFLVTSFAFLCLRVLNALINSLIVFENA